MMPPPQSLEVTSPVLGEERYPLLNRRHHMDDQLNRDALEVVVQERSGTPRVAVVRLRGEHDMASAVEVRRRLDQAVATGPTIVDLSACSFLDSSIIACLIHAYRQQGGLSVVLPAGDSAAYRALLITGLHEFLTCRDSLDEAIEAAIASAPRAVDDEEQYE
jgi:anti-anti-sigma factor